ncbi:anti-sigma factor domain-containing protein [Jeotgalibacillus sp. R-1-5s-1]|uniref:anti-sigma factor domain-containing protein n=1 Tax=Jeotgalibacillus sp. R-1-5s-1 TaxID=2555897 RepID=UPI00106A42F4|nr:anti-sigma factor domain-containing protein [Jeotgalibacillus sp. R-1-5s-1]TFE03691.1 anti-sigma factor domain-containing protein [Jeotgalibacillus sp. R-1-5s-1]
MKKGMIMEIHKRHVVLMTRSGEFCKVAKPSGSLSIGEEVVSYPLERSRLGALSSIGALAAVALIMFFLMNPYFNDETYAHIAVDINPSFELLINENAEVIEWNGLNEDAEKLNHQLNLEGESVQEAMSEIIAASGKAGFINENNETVTVSAVYTNESSTTFQQEMRKMLDEWSDQENKMNNTAAISIQEGTVSDLAAAEKQGISFGKIITGKTTALTALPLKQQPVLPPLKKKDEEKVITEAPEKEVTESAEMKNPESSDADKQSEESPDRKNQLPSAASHGQNMKQQKQERNEERKQEKQKDEPDKTNPVVSTDSEDGSNSNKEKKNDKNNDKPDNEGKGPDDRGNKNKDKDDKGNKNKGPGNNNGNGNKGNEDGHPGNGKKKDNND